MPVSNRNTETILPIMRQYVAPDSIIHTDKWRANDALQNENYTHLTANRSENFVDSITNVYTQNIEKLWREMRANIPRYEISTVIILQNFYLKEVIITVNE